MRSIVWPVKVFDSVPDRAVVLLHSLVLLAFLSPIVHARERGECSSDVAGTVAEQAGEGTNSVHTTEPLTAFQRPSREAVDVAASRIYLVLAIAGLGIILLFIGTACYYSENSWRTTSTPTEVKRAPGVVLKPRQREEKNQRWELLDE